MKLTDIKGIGPKTEELFRRIGVETPEDLIHYYPVGYDAYEAPVAIGAVTVGAKCAVEGYIAGSVTMRRFNRVQILTTEIQDPTGKIRLTWFNAPFLQKMLKKGSCYIFRGTVKEKNGRLTMDHPEIHTPAKYEEIQKTLVPVYSLTKGLTGKMIAKAVKEAMHMCLPAMNEFLPESLMRAHGLMDETDAIRVIHFPETKEEFLMARKRLVFDEFFLFVLGVRSLRAKEEEAVNCFPMTKVWETEEVIEHLPFPLTRAQRRVWREIEQDLAGKKPMSRLIQGDVGSGKTILSFLAMIMAASNGYQSVLMAPTEVLARQHFEKFTALAADDSLGFVKPILLTGSMTAGEKRDAYARIEDGTVNTVIGTHAVFQEKVSYRALSLVITDEQHRFGVRQREALLEKGMPPNTMVMSATPIPRTLGVIYYGDLDLSVIDEMPGSRLPIKTAVVDLSWREKALAFMGRKMAEGRQVYVICPMIEESEELDAADAVSVTSEMKKVYPDRRIAMLHGRMRPDEKNAVMEQFLAGETDMLVSTTVIEVGVDVPNATVMLVLNAERFGLAQLHQLRGRVGRGKEQSYCIFMAGQKSDAVAERLMILGKSTDGFEIAEKDFAMRGPGDLLGIRQSGDAMFRIADISKDGAILALAGETAASVLADDPALISEEYCLLGKALKDYMRANERKIVL